VAAIVVHHVALRLPNSNLQNLSKLAALATLHAFANAAARKLSPVFIMGLHHGPKNAGELVGQCHGHEPGLRANSVAIQPRKAPLRLPRPWRSEVAASTSRRLKHRLPFLVMAKVSVCRQSSFVAAQGQAEKSRPRLKTLGSVRCDRRGNQLADTERFNKQANKQAARRLPRMRRGDVRRESGELSSPAICQARTLAARLAALASVASSLRAREAHRRGQCLWQSFGSHNAELRKMATQRIDALDAHRLPLDEQFARPVQHRHGLVLRALDRHEAHAGAGHGFSDRCGVGRIVLTAFDIGLDVDRRNQPDIMAHHGPKLRARAPNSGTKRRPPCQQGRGRVLRIAAEELPHLHARELARHGGSAFARKRANLKIILGKTRAY
jgi:hypothetical protein